MMFGKKEVREREQAQRDLIIQYKRAFGSPEGKAVLFDLMNRHHVLYTHGGDALKEGQRSVVLDILRNCNINLEQFDKMLLGEEGQV